MPFEAHDSPQFLEITVNFYDVIDDRENIKKYISQIFDSHQWLPTELVRTVTVNGVSHVESKRVIIEPQAVTTKLCVERTCFDSVDSTIKTLIQGLPNITKFLNENAVLDEPISYEIQSKDIMRCWISRAYTGKADILVTIRLTNHQIIELVLDKASIVTRVRIKK